MLVGENIKVEADSLNVTVYQRGTSKTNRVYWRPIAYFSTVRNAFEWLANQELQLTGLKNLETVVKRQDEIEEMIKGLMPPDFVTVAETDIGAIELPEN